MCYVVDKNGQITAAKLGKFKIKKNCRKLKKLQNLCKFENYSNFTKYEKGEGSRVIQCLI